jgi:hypothetical protein
MRTIIRRATGEQIRVTAREFQIMVHSGEVTVNGLSTYVLVREDSERVFDPFGEPFNISTSTAVKKEPKKFSKEFDNLLDSYIHLSKTISTNPILYKKVLALDRDPNFNWVDIFDMNSINKMLYVLQIVEALIDEQSFIKE